MAEYTASAVQTVNPGESVIFTETLVPCRRGFVRHRDGASNFLLSGWLPSMPLCRCPCLKPDSAEYLIKFGANIAVPTGGIAEAISLAVTLDGATIPASTMIVTPAAVEQYFNISRDVTAEVWQGCCETVSIRNISDQPILVANPDIILNRPDLALTR